MTAQQQHNPIHWLLRAVGVCAIVAGAYWLWRLGVGAWPSLDALNVAEYLVGFAVLGVLLAIAIGAVRAPSRLHLSISVALAVFVGVAFVNAKLSTLIENVLRPEAVETARKIFFWVWIAVTIIVAIPLERWLAKRAGFVPKDQLWWTPNNIRGLCTLFTWVLFFIGLSWIEPDNLKNVVVEEYRHGASVVLFFGLVVGCLLFGKIGPTLLMKLTGVPYEPPALKRRGFRII